MNRILSHMLVTILVFGISGSARAEGTTTKNGNNSRPNVLFFAFDDLRPLIGAYGEPEPITPHLDALAGDGIRFDRNYVAYPLCNPSRATMLTGIRFDNRPVTGWKPMSHLEMIRKQATWPRVLREAGYWTASRGKVYHGDVPKPDQSAWDIHGGKNNDWNEEIVSAIADQGGRIDQLEAYLNEGKGSNALIYVAVDGPDDLLNDGQVCDDVISYIKDQRDPDKPFAITCGFSRPHMPWVAPKKYFDLYPEDAGKLAYLPEGIEKKVDEEEITPKNENGVWNEGVDDSVAQRLIRGYMACTTYVDAQMGRVIQTLKAEGLYENTIIVAWGDHGYHLTDHGLWRKNTAYHVSMRAPLVIKVPGVAGRKTVDQVVSNVDIYPTLMELTGVGKPAEVEFHGKSLVPLLNSPEASWENITYTCAKGRYGVVTDKYRFTVSENRTSLYDLETDPHEWNNLGSHPEYASVVEQFEAKLAKAVWNETDRTQPVGDSKPTAAKPKMKESAKEWDWFGSLDENEDGAVTEEEWLKRSQAKANKKGQVYEQARQRQLFADRDLDDNGTITRKELDARTRKKK